jgi:hypothetical protein
VRESVEPVHSEHGMFHLDNRKTEKLRCRLGYARRCGDLSEPGAERIQADRGWIRETHLPEALRSPDEIDR